MMLATERAQYLVDNLDLPYAAQYEGAKWEHFQIAHLEDESVFRCEVKSRQIAWSWLCAAEAVADGILTGYGSVFVSINLDEAKEKIRYAKNIIAALPKGHRPKLITDNRTELEFDNGARLISLPSTAPRGKAQMHIKLDEFAHVRDDRIIYSAALPMMTKGDTRLRIGSSPFGASGLHWEIYKQEIQPYPGYTRKVTPWWHIQAFCKDVFSAFREAPNMTTRDRVMRFGNDRIVMIYENLLEEDFQQEYECAFIDEATAWITWEEIKNIQDDNLICHISYNNGAIDNAIAIIDEMQRASLQGEIESAFYAGYDVGRTRNTSELFIVGHTTVESSPLRAAITLDNCEYDDQLEIISYAMTKLPIISMLIDRNGIGNNLAENAEKRFPGHCQGVNFTNTTKTMWATNAKMLTQQRRVPIPVNRDIAYQIHSIKKKVTPAKNVVFDTEKNEKHHADKFWAWVLAIYGRDQGHGWGDNPTAGYRG